MNSKSVIRAVYSGMSIQDIRERFRFTIRLNCGEEFSFFNYKILDITEELVSIKIQFQLNGRFIPCDRKIKMKDAPSKTIPRSLVLKRSMIQYHNVPEIEGLKKPRKIKLNKFEVIGKLVSELGRVPSEHEIQEAMK